MKKDSKIYVAGHAGLVGSALIKALNKRGYFNIIGKTKQELDLRDYQKVSAFFKKEQPEYVILAAAKVGGIHANNTYRADFIWDNLMIQNNIIDQSYRNGIKKLLFLGSSCIYPKNCPQPIKEEYLLTSKLEYTNEPYAIAKIAGIKTIESYNIQYGTNFISVMPTNLYGPNDNFDLETSHVLPALVRKIHLGKSLEGNNWSAIRTDFEKRPINGVNGNSSEQDIIDILEKHGIYKNKNNSCSIEVWGTGKPFREFLWSEEMAEACVYIMENVDFIDIIKLSGKQEYLTIEDFNKQNIIIRDTHLNIGTGKEISIKKLAELIKEVVGFRGDFNFNSSKPDGTIHKLTDVSKLKELGWKHQINIEMGVSLLYKWYLENI